MGTDGSIRRLRGAVGNALVWGAGWFALALSAFAALHVVGMVPETVSWLDAVGMAIRIAVIGTVSGGAFSTVIGLLYRGRRLSEISPVRFGVAGGVVTGVFVPLFLQAMNLLSGDGMVPMALVLDDAVWTAVFGGVAAGATLRLAQRADRALPAGSRDGLGRLEGGERPA